MCLGCIGLSGETMKNNVVEIGSNKNWVNCKSTMASMNFVYFSISGRDEERIHFPKKKFSV